MIVGVVNGDPVPRRGPPLEEANHLNVPALELAAKFNVPVPHLEAGVVPVMVGVVQDPQ